MCRSDFENECYPISKEILTKLSQHPSYKIFLKYVAYVICPLVEFKKAHHIKKMSDIEHFTVSNEAFVLLVLDNHWDHWMFKICRGLMLDRMEEEEDVPNKKAPKPKYTNKSV